jgi:hypothetical protein
VPERLLYLDCRARDCRRGPLRRTGLLRRLLHAAEGRQALLDLRHLPPHLIPPLSQLAHLRLQLARRGLLRLAGRRRRCGLPGRLRCAGFEAGDERGLVPNLFAHADHEALQALLHTPLRLVARLPAVCLAGRALFPLSATPAGL